VYIAYNLASTLDLAHAKGGGEADPTTARRYIGIVVVNTLVSITMAIVQIATRKHWVLGLVQIMWSFMIVVVFIITWYISLELEKKVKAGRAQTASPEQKKSDSSGYW
jgi:hypothetical protein